MRCRALQDWRNDCSTIRGKKRLCALPLARPRPMQQRRFLHGCRGLRAPPYENLLPAAGVLLCLDYRTEECFMPINQHNKKPENFTERIHSLLGLGVPEDTINILPTKGRFNILFLLFIVLFFFFLQPYFFSARVETIPHSPFKQDLAEGTVTGPALDPEHIKGKLTGTPGREFMSVRVDDPGLVKELDERKILYSGRYQNKFLTGLLSWILPLG